MNREERNIFSICKLRRKRQSVFWVLASYDELVRENQGHASTFLSGYAGSGQAAYDAIQAQAAPGVEPHDYGANTAAGVHRGLSAERRRLRAEKKAQESSTAETSADTPEFLYHHELSYGYLSGLKEYDTTRHRITRRTKLRVYFEREDYVSADRAYERAYGHRERFVDRAALERDGEARGRFGGDEWGTYTTTATPPGAAVPRCLAVLRLKPDATIGQVRTAFKRLAKKHHPDKGGDGERFKRIHTAYEQALLLLRGT